ncbi:MAG TPA: bifunctional alpha,alpha-trehalose-phosphate synthase (UDP-forming)/trehalose-phosphatase [Gemmatimonadales bacterium]|nr:bifunctional alpha,alpha-trehalose-phosphate synthase (UDP-forming)/trehalose-phosphatase [Gemmatimonadales bacterium]
MATILVSNRLPVTIRASADGVTLTDSHGGLATGLRGIHRGGDGVWIGWPGPIHQLASDVLPSVDRELADRGYVPVHLTREEIRGFYHGFSNEVLWPLFHYLIQQVPLAPRHWEEYERVNLRFAEVVARHCGPHDEVWIHDYQLMRLPALLRRLRPSLRIGFFLHIPFPAYEVFRILPMRRQLLEGLLGADLIGFHIRSYAQHFTASVSRLLGVPLSDAGRFEYEGRTPVVGVFPMGIDMARFEGVDAGSPFSADRGPMVSARSGKILVGIDRLDYTKGIPRRLLAFEHLLRTPPELRERVTLVQVAVPSRTGVRAYRRFRRRVDAMVGRINGTFGTPGWTPVRYLYRGFNQSELVGLFRSADVMLVTPVRDGMNLVAKEFIASRIDGDGVLVLSEFTGAAEELAEAVEVNPFDIAESAEVYASALAMSRQERRARMLALRARIRANPVEQWSDRFLTRLRTLPRLSGAQGNNFVSAEQVSRLTARMRGAPGLVLALDYDGTLAPFAALPDLAIPDDEILRLLAALAARPATSVHLVSGRQREVLESWFGELDLGLHAEHGAWSRNSGDDQWQRHVAVHPLPYDELVALAKTFSDRTPGSMIERKSAGLAWHFRLAHPDLGVLRAEALIGEVRRRFEPETVEVLRGERVVEVRPTGVNKGLVINRLQQTQASRDLVVALGDDSTDEDMFAALSPGNLGVHVGPGPTGAHFRLRDVAASRAFLRGLLVDHASPNSRCYMVAS